MSVSTQLATKFVTTDGQQFDTRGAAIKHQRQIDAVRAVADELMARFELDLVVGINIAAYLAQQPDTVMALVGKTARKPKTTTVDAASDDVSDDAGAPVALDDSDAANFGPA